MTRLTRRRRRHHYGKPSSNRQACGSCHDGINFDTGEGLTLADKAAGKTVSTDFFGKAHPDKSTDGTCLNSSCHNPGAGGDPDLVHKPVTPPNTTSALHVAGGSANVNAAWIASNQNRLPTGAIKVEYELGGVDLALPARNPRLVFRMKQNGVVTPLQDFATAAVNPVTQQKEIWANFMGAPSVYFVYAMPQDGITKPADFNQSASVYLRCLWNGTAGTMGCGFNTTGATAGTPSSLAGTLTGPDANGFYTATMTGRTVPTNAVDADGRARLLVQQRSTVPLTQTNLPAYPAKASTVPLGSTTVFPWPSSPDPGYADLFPGMPNATGGLIVIAPNVTRLPTASPVAVRSSKTSAATRATRNSGRLPRMRSMPASATTARPARGATRRTGQAVAGRRTRQRSCMRSTARPSAPTLHLACGGSGLTTRPIQRLLRRSCIRVCWRAASSATCRTRTTSRRLRRTRRESARTARRSGCGGPLRPASTGASRVRR